MIARHTAQDMNAAFSRRAAAIATAIMAETEIEMEIGTGMATAIAEAGAVEAMAVMALAPHISTDIRTESTMARVTGAPATAIAQRKTATTNTATVATVQAMAIKITTNKPTVRRMRTDTNRATTAVAAGAGTNLFTNEKKPCGELHGFYFWWKIRGTLMPPDFYQTVQRSAS